MNKQELLPKILELNKKTKALKKKVGAEEILEAFPRDPRTANGNSGREGIFMINKHTYPDWTKEEIKKLKELYPTLTTEEIGRTLRRTKIAVRSKAFDLGLKKDNAFFRKTAILSGRKDLWMEDEIQTLKREYLRAKTSTELTRVLKRTVFAIRTKALRLGLRLENPDNAQLISGRLGERKAENLFQQMGWKIIAKQQRIEGYLSAYDFIVEKEGKQIAVNVKHGEHASITKRNLNRLLKYSPCAFLFLTNDDKAFFMPVVELNISATVS